MLETRSTHVKTMQILCVRQSFQGHRLRVDSFYERCLSNFLTDKSHGVGSGKWAGYKTTNYSVPQNIRKAAIELFIHCVCPMLLEEPVFILITYIFKICGSNFSIVFTLIYGNRNEDGSVCTSRTGRTPCSNFNATWRHLVYSMRLSADYHLLHWVANATI